ncbi:hypothetical protein B0H11DRAFT_1904305 [Mycena galericulata]|nr:hypothetical protein B0H11DRAFT_1904305 [Mycena galericulata]
MFSTAAFGLQHLLHPRPIDSLRHCPCVPHGTAHSELANNVPADGRVFVVAYIAALALQRLPNCSRRQRLASATVLPLTLEVGPSGGSQISMVDEVNVRPLWGTVTCEGELEWGQSSLPGFNLKDLWYEYVNIDNSRPGSGDVNCDITSSMMFLGCSPFHFHAVMHRPRHAGCERVASGQTDVVAAAPLGFDAAVGCGVLLRVSRQSEGRGGHGHELSASRRAWGRRSGVWARLCRIGAYGALCIQYRCAASMQVESVVRSARFRAAAYCPSVVVSSLSYTTFTWIWKARCIGAVMARFFGGGARTLFGRQSGTACDAESSPESTSALAHCSGPSMVSFQEELVSDLVPRSDPHPHPAHHASGLGGVPSSDE